MKKILALIVIGVIGYFGYSYYTDNNVGDKPADSTWHNTGEATLRVSKGNVPDPYKPGHDDFSPAVGTLLAPDSTWTNVNGGDWGYLVVDILNGTAYLTTTTVKWKDASGTKLDPPVSEAGDGTPDNLLKFTPNSDGSYNVEYTKTAIPTPPTTGLIDWSGGQTGKSPFATPGSYWVQDYNFDDTTRWTSDGTSTVQGTQQTGNNKYGFNYGSRAYPVNILNDNYDIDNNAYGVGMDGVWQIDIKVGSNGGLKGTLDTLYCETFYIAERVNMIWNNKYYLDNSPKGGSNKYSQYGREIDIMETKWQPTGPQVNLPNGNSSNPQSQMSWNTDLSGTDGYNHLATVWDSMYTTFPKPTTYATFGVAILSDGLYFYGYNDKGKQVYCDGPHPQKNDGYKQTGPFVPYIGTWTRQNLGSCDATDPKCTDPFKPGTAGDFSTSYKNFKYATSASMGTNNPKDHPELFGPGLK
tara:strand:+ start:835 stop:2235 length:1401 start_codon:yes stop_codon:yes gene_type:complete